MNATSVSTLSVRDGKGLKTRPWGHQRLAIDFLQKTFWKPREVLGPDGKALRAPDGGGAMLAMFMGTGKSLVGVSMLCNLPVEDVLIAGPMRVVDVWIGQIRQHAGVKLRVARLDDTAGSVADKLKLAKQQQEIARIRGERFVAVINYESLWREPFAKWALKQTWGLTILDESHRIKQASGKASMFCARLRNRSIYRLELTGTPLPHSPLDIYAQYRFLRPDILGTNYHAFKQTYSVMGGFQAKQIVGFQNLPDLEEKMGRIMFRVGKDVLDLPPETRVTYECDLSPEARRAYRSMEDAFVAEVQNGTVTAANAMVKLLRLQQITGGFVKTDAGDVVPASPVNAKADLLADTLEDIAADEAVVVFCRFHADLDTVHDVARRMKRESLELSGRHDQLSEWRAGKAPILAVQISAGGIGVNLTRARYTVYFSLTFSLGEYDQSLARVHRPGQTRPVTQIHLAARNTVDQKVMRALERRAEVVNAVLDEIKQEAL